jgi:hypothetical protein
LAAAIARFIIAEAVPKGFGLKVVVELDLVTVWCHWGNGLGRVTLPLPSTPRFLIAEAVPKGFGLMVVVGVAVIDLPGWGRNRAAGNWLVIFGRRVSLTAGPIWPAGRRELFADADVSFRAPLADHRRAVPALQVRHAFVALNCVTMPAVMPLLECTAVVASGDVVVVVVIIASRVVVGVCIRRMCRPR